MVSLNEQIGQNDDFALEIFLRACHYEATLGFSAVRRSLRESIDGTNGLESFESLYERLTPPALAAGRAELEQGQAEGFRLVTFQDPDYPREFFRLPDPPASFWLRGRLELGQPVGIVGSRRCSNAGAQFARTLAENLTVEAVPVVSGLARGIDAAAHRGAVAACRDSTLSRAGVAILGSGLLRLYPAEHRHLADEIVECGGAIISEYCLTQPPLPPLFPDRNRLIAGLSDQLVVVEAGERSGSLITARLAVEIGRNVFVVPGPVHEPAFRGSNSLLRLGCRPLLSPDELEELLPIGWQPQSPRGRKKKRKVALEAILARLFTEEPKRKLALTLVERCSAAERSLDELADLIAEPPAVLLPLLTLLEMNDLLRRTGAGQWTLVI